jgi:hypothetical protein
MTDEPLETTLPGSFYRRGSRWWWRVQLPGEDKPRSRPLRPPGSHETTTEKKAALEIAAALWQSALQNLPDEQPKDETDAGTEAEVAAAAAPELKEEPVVEPEPSQEARAEISAPADAPEPPEPEPRTAVCECCSRNHLPDRDMSRIDSGQLLCRDCLAELRRKASET